MRVLVSAYACEPNQGSEQEVGWQRALHMLALADEVWVITRANNQQAIEADSLSHTSGLHFIYYDLPWWALKLKKQAWFLPIYFIFWQYGAYRLVRRHHREKSFDCVYHVTFASLKFASFMGRLGIPFVIGPVAGGERTPFRLRRSMPFVDKVTELLRDLEFLLQRYSPVIRPALAAAEKIFVTTPDSVRIIPPKWRGKTAVHLAIATRGNALQNVQRQAVSQRFVFAGRLLYWKGAHLAIRALAQARVTMPEATLTLIGGGPAEKWLREVAKKSGVASAVEFIGYLSHKQLLDSLQKYTSLVFPSLHDSGGFAVLEALSIGLPVVCLDLGGPGIMVNRLCGIVVQTAHANEIQVVAGIAKAMVCLGTMPDTDMSRLSAGAIARANELSWEKLTEDIAGHLH
jgi:glycosyltransferase involved in cell wall biosynthesis